MERLNTKYNLECFSDSELDSESNDGEQYQYKHGYERLMWRTLENQNNRKARIFGSNIIFEKYLTDDNTKVLKNQNLQLKYSLDFSNYLDAYLYSCYLGRQFCKIVTHQL